MNIALYRNGQYYKASVVEGHVIECKGEDNTFAEFYDVWTKMDYGFVLTEEMLKSFEIPNLGCIKTNEGIQVFDVTKEEYIEEELPVYVDVFGSIKKSKKWINLKTPTEDSIKASKDIYKEIEMKLKKEQNEKDIQHIRELIEKGCGIAYIDVGINGIYRLVDIFYREGIKVLFSRNGKYVIGKTATKPVLDLYVHERLIHVIIGKGGERIKKIASEINAKRINVKAIEE